MGEDDMKGMMPEPEEVKKMIPGPLRKQLKMMMYSDPEELSEHIEEIVEEMPDIIPQRQLNRLMSSLEDFADSDPMPSSDEVMEVVPAPLAAQLEMMMYSDPEKLMEHIEEIAEMKPKIIGKNQLNKLLGSLGEFDDMDMDDMDGMMPDPEEVKKMIPGPLRKQLKMMMYSDPAELMEHIEEIVEEMPDIIPQGQLNRLMSSLEEFAGSDPMPSSDEVMEVVPEPLAAQLEMMMYSHPEELMEHIEEIAEMKPKIIGKNQLNKLLGSLGEFDDMDMDDMDGMMPDPEEVKKMIPGALRKQLKMMMYSDPAELMEHIEEIVEEMPDIIPQGQLNRLMSSLEEFAGSDPMPSPDEVMEVVPEPLAAQLEMMMYSHPEELMEHIEEIAEMKPKIIGKGKLNKLLGSLGEFDDMDMDDMDGMMPDPEEVKKMIPGALRKQLKMMMYSDPAELSEHIEEIVEEMPDIIPQGQLNRLMSSLEEFAGSDPMPSSDEVMEVVPEPLAAQLEMMMYSDPEKLMEHIEEIAEMKPKIIGKGKLEKLLGSLGEFDGMDMDDMDGMDIQEKLKGAKLYNKGFKEDRIGLGRTGSDLLIDWNKDGMFGEEGDFKIEDFWKGKTKQKGGGYMKELGNRKGNQLLRVPNLPDELIDGGGEGMMEEGEMAPIALPGTGPGMKTIRKFEAGDMFMLPEDVMFEDLEIKPNAAGTWTFIDTDGDRLAKIKGAPDLMEENFVPFSEDMMM